MDLEINKLFRAICIYPLERLTEVVGEYHVGEIDWQASIYQGLSPLEFVIFYGSKLDIVLFIMKQSTPPPDMNALSAKGFTLLMQACARGSTEVVKYLLADPRVDVQFACSESTGGFTAFDLAIFNLHEEVIRHFIASGREIGLNPNDAKFRSLLDDLRQYERRKLAEQRWHERNGDCLGSFLLYSILHGTEDDDTIKDQELVLFTLLQQFMKAPDLTRHQLRLSLGYRAAHIAELYGMIIFLCDGLFRLRALPKLWVTRDNRLCPGLVLLSTNMVTDQESNGNLVGLPLITPAHTFFSIVQRLPMELQMLVCHRVYDSTKEIVVQKESEGAFQHLVVSCCRL